MCCSFSRRCLRCGGRRRRGRRSRSERESRVRRNKGTNCFFRSICVCKWTRSHFVSTLGLQLFCFPLIRLLIFHRITPDTDAGHMLHLHSASFSPFLAPIAAPRSLRSRFLFFSLPILLQFSRLFCIEFRPNDAADAFGRIYLPRAHYLRFLLLVHFVDAAARCSSRFC